MKKQEFLQFGERWHYPFLVLGSGQYLAHGKSAYEEASPVIIRLASKRIERWHALITQERVTEALERVDNLLISRHGSNVERVEV
jgi:hypothetical protein